MNDKTVDFYWDAGSTNTYFGVFLLPDILQRTGATVRWRPFNLGYVFRNHNYVLSDEPPVKLRNRRRDLERWAEHTGLPFKMPPKFPIKTSHALRGSLTMRQLNLETEYIEAIFKAYWEEGRIIEDYDVLSTIAVELDVDPDRFTELSESEEIKNELIAETNDGLERGVFGAPTFMVGDEMFWGKDRLDFLERELLKPQS